METSLDNVVGSTARLHIEALASRHAPLLFAGLRDARLYTYIGDEPPRSVALLAARFDRLAAGSRSDEIWRNWVMFDRSDGAVVGTLQATIHPDHRALIAYVLLPEHWRRGLGREGVAWMLDHLQRCEGVRRAEALIDTRNQASIRLVEASGFQRLETLRDAAVLHGEPSHEYRYGRTLDGSGGSACGVTS